MINRYKHVEIHRLLALDKDNVLSANNETYPKYLATPSGFKPIFKRGEDIHVALEFIVMYPEVHVSSSRIIGIGEELVTNYIQ